ncbi:MAG: cytochrome P450 [Polyangiales bacterium]
MHPQSYPGPRATPFIGPLRHLVRQDVLTHLCSLRAQYGDVVHLGAASGSPTFLIAGPDATKHVLQDNNRNYRKGRAAQRMKSVFGSGSLLLEGDQWRIRRRLVQPAFHREKISSVVDTFAEAAEGLAKRLRNEGEDFDVREEMLALTMQLTVRNMFSSNIQGELGELIGAWHVLYESLTSSRFSPLQALRWLPTPTSRRQRAARETVDRVLFRLIEAQRLADTDDGSVLSMLVRAVDDDGVSGMSDAEIRDETMTIFVGGYETSSNALAFSLALLADNPSFAERHFEEVRGVLGANRPTIADLASLPLNRMLLQESMRLYPPSWLITREAIAEDVLNGVQILAGAQLLLSSYVTHHDPSHWNAPDDFNPMRFSDAESASRPKFTYFPFGVGRDFA